MRIETAVEAARGPGAGLCFVAMSMLILFDIDGTLYHGDGSGRAAFGDTARAMFGEAFVDHAIEFAGRLDSYIYSELLRLNGIEITDEITKRFMDLSPGFLKKRIESGQYHIRQCDGAFDLVRRLLALRDEHDITLGLLTGNWPRNGRVKISSVGFEPEWFTVNAWGDDGPTRNDLPPVARRRYREFFNNGREIGFDRMVIVGDTIHDVACARAHGCRSLATATGWCSMEELEAAGADRTVPDLTETDDLVDWMRSAGVVR